MKHLYASRIGCLVQFDHAPFKAIGVFKNGVDFVSAAGEMIYLTLSPQRGPYHLSVPSIDQYIQLIEPGHSLYREDDIIQLPGLDIQILLKNALRWPKYAVPPICPWEKMKAAIQKTLKDSNDIEIPKNSIFRSINWGFDKTSTPSVNPLAELSPESKVLATRIPTLCCALKHSDPENALKESKSILGLGNGLTPSGDDILAGILSVLYDLGNAGLKQTDWISCFSTPLLSLSKTKTNLISAALLSAAAQGEIDETLDDIIFSLLNGNSPTQEMWQNLKTFGHTSGFDGLVGILLALLSLLPQSQ